ncbi:MAG: UDP-N-acetylmuramoyl-tripeptide--D-alanyl-D-alanine ligase [Endomicrobia bacterium]|nr:UDP-N-acetylmuramoyl-tripeptide--D-alanyl-D-alanine ligase [Endomicrobiia bacterium]
MVVGGSNGKTTTKELIKKLLEEKYNVVASKGNQNNLIGLSYTLFSIKKNTDYCIAELGISLPGEMDYLAKTVQPDCIVITNIGKEHLEFLKNTKNVFKEETKVIKYLKPNGIIVLNKDDIFLKKLTNKNIKWYAIHDKTAEVLLKDIRYSRTYTQAKIKIEDETLNIKTRLLGEYNVYNILAAITVANYFTKMKKKTIRYALKNFKPVEMRGQKFKLYNSIVIDETYNANPDSMKSSISEFLKIFRKDKKIIVLSDMLELGKSSIKEHENLKNYIPLEKIEYLFLIGEKIYFLYKTLQKNKKIFYYKNLNNKVLRKITEIAKKNSFVMLFKGSHGSNLWQLVEKLKHIGGK